MLDGSDSLLIASLEVNLLVGVAVISCPGVHKDAADIVSWWTLRSLARKVFKFDRTVDRLRLRSKQRHGFFFSTREASMEPTNPGTKSIHLRGYMEYGGRSRQGARAVGSYQAI